MKKKINLTISPKRTRLKMSKDELERYMAETRKSAHVFKNKKKYDRKKEKKSIDF